jgi:hypothetical protein
MSPLWKINIIIAIVFGAFVHCSTRECRAEALSIYDSPSDKKKVVVEVCAEKCHVLITDKKTLESDYQKIEKWFNFIVESEK